MCSVPTIMIDFSALGTDAEPQEQVALPMTWSGNSISLSSSRDGQTATLTGTASKSGDDEIMKGQMVMAVGSEGQMLYRLYGEWTVIKQ